MSIVYGTGIGAICPGCRRPVAQCVCKSASGKPIRPAEARAVRVSRQTQGRAGKSVTVITGLPLSGTAHESLATELKRRCGSGSTLRDGLNEIQGEHRDKLVEELIRRGFPAKRAGSRYHA